MKLTKSLEFTGERIVTNLEKHVGATEHLHRYALALNFCKGKKVLDIACGEGYGSNLISKVAFETIGVDISKEAVLHAKRKYENETLQFVEGSADSIPAENNTFDVVVSFETIEHHDKHQEMFSEIKRVLKPEGVLVISSPEKSIYHRRDGNNPFHVKELTYQEFSSLVRRNFKQSHFFIQTNVHGSLILPVTVNNSTFTVFGGNFDNITNCLSDNSEFYNQPYFNLAIASDTDISVHETSFFDGADVIELKLSKQHEMLQKIYNSTSYKLGNAIVSIFNKVPFLKSLKRLQ